MKWLRYCIVMLSFIMFSPVSQAGEDPIGWRVTGSIPAQTVNNLVYTTPILTYTFINNMPFRMVTPLFIAKVAKPGGDFSFPVDTCSGKRLKPKEPCIVTVNFTPTTLGVHTVQLLEEYGRNVVPLPIVSTNVTGGTNPLITGTVTIPLPATMAEGATAPFQFTYTNHNNGTVTNVATPTSNVNINPNPGGSGTLSGLTVTPPTCSGPTTLAPGASCVVNGNFTAGIAGAYTVNDSITYHGGSGITSLHTSTVASQQFVCMVTPLQGLPTTMGAGEQQPFSFTCTNNGTLPITPTSSIITPIGGTVASTPPASMPVLDNCSAHVIAGGTSCTISGVFSSFTPSPPPYSITLVETLPGGAQTVPAVTTSTGSILIINPAAPSITTPLPSNMGAGETDPVVFTWTNNGSGKAYGITTPAMVNQTGGTFTETGGSCTTVTSLAPGISCTYTGTFTSNGPGPVSLTVGFNYAGGTNVVQETTSATASIQIINPAAPSITTPLPSNMGAGETDPVVFTWKNNGSGTANLVATPTVVSQTGGTFTAAASPPLGTCGTVGFTTLPAGASCTYTGTFTSGGPGSASLTVGFNYAGGTNVVQETTSATTTTKVTGAATTPLPPGGMGTGETQPVVFTFTNTGPGTVSLSGSSVAVTASGGTFTHSATPPSSECTPSMTLAPFGSTGDSCTWTGTFTSGAVTSYSVSATLTYGGGTTTAMTTDTGTIRVQGNIAPGLPLTIGTGETHDVVVTYTNNGTGPANVIQDPSGPSSLVTAGGSCVGGATASCQTTPSCTPDTSTFPLAQLFPGCTCTVTCHYMANVPSGGATVSSTITYAGGTSPVLTTSSTASVDVKAITPPPIPLPSSTTPGTTYPITLGFTNTGSASVSGAPAMPPITVSPGPSTQLSAPVYDPNPCPTTLASGQTCLISVNFTPAAAGMATVTALYSYMGGLVSSSTSTTVTFARKLTINNYCPTDVWFSFNGAPTRKGCSDTNPCVKGSSCNKDADGGKGICYWTNPSPAKGGLHLGPMTELKPTATTILVIDKDAKNSTLWSGSIAGRTGCSGKSCETADCNSNGGDKACPPGNNFTLPATLADLTLMRDVEDKYSIQAGNGINLSVSMGPTHPDKTTPAYNASNPYYCATPGSADASRIFNACSWMLKPPAYPNASSAVDYVWVKQGTGGACSTNACPGSEVCGLSFNNGKFAQVCGKQLGYWTANQACLLNAVGASSYFDCKSAMTQTAGNVLQDLNVCTNSSPQGTSPEVCAKAGNKEKAAMVQWIKSACPSVSAFAGDTAKSSFTCKTDESESKTKNNSNIKMNVTEYTISFCPEMAPGSQFRHLKGTASNP